MSNKNSSRFQRGSGVYACRSCGRNTRYTGGDGAGVKMCDECYELAGEENSLSDTGALYGSPENVLAMIEAVEAKSGNLTVWLDLKGVATKALSV